MIVYDPSFEMLPVPTYVCPCALQDKILQSMSKGNEVTVTNDGATILKSVYVDNPAAKVLVGESRLEQAVQRGHAVERAHTVQMAVQRAHTVDMAVQRHTHWFKCPLLL